MLAFVVLHYNTIDDTVKCVNSILKFSENNNAKVVIVDNNSPNGSGRKLEIRYKNNDDVKVIINKDNIGFSKANNIGCSYAIDNYKPDYICVLNNDTYIDDYNFHSKINTFYAKTQFDILGPQIWNTKRKYNQNPRNVISNIEEIDKLILKNQRNKKLLNSKLSIVSYIYMNFFPNVRLEKKGVFGAAIIFSKKYFQKYDTIFPEISFMYGEENFLYYRTVKDNLGMHINNNLKVYHNHSSSTSSISKGTLEKWKFQNKYILKSLEKLRKVYINDKRI